MLGYPDAALADVDRALSDAREIGHAATLMFALAHSSSTHMFCGNYTAATAEANELVALADEKGAEFWKPIGMFAQGCVVALADAAAAVEMISSGITAYRLTGSTVNMPLCFHVLAWSYAQLGKFDDAWRCIDEAMVAIKTAKETMHEAEANRVAGEIALKSPQLDAAKAESYFERALAVARSQLARSWELRAAMSMARLWRDQGKPQQARELLAPVYRWFTEGFDTLDLKEAKALLEELASRAPG